MIKRHQTFSDQTSLERVVALPFRVKSLPLLALVLQGLGPLQVCKSHGSRLDVDLAPNIEHEHPVSFPAPIPAYPVGPTGAPVDVEHLSPPTAPPWTTTTEPFHSGALTMSP